MKDEFNSGYAYELEDYDALESTSIPMTFSLADVDISNALDFHEIEDIHPIENQGAMGSCQGHSLSSQLEVIRYLATGEWLQMSRLHAYLASQQVDNLLGRDAGSTISGGVKVAKEQGLILEEKMPYPNPVRYPGKTWFLNRVQQPEVQDTERFKIKNHIRINSYEDQLALLASRAGTGSAGMYWPIDLDQGNVCREYRFGNGMHAVAFLAIDKSRTDGDGNPLLACANSHGKNYGDGGWCFWTKYAFEKMLRTRNCVVYGVSDMDIPGPRDFDLEKDPIL